jgi:hypothetical protein
MRMYMSSLNFDWRSELERAEMTEEVTFESDRIFKILSEYPERVKKVNPPCLRWDGLQYDSHDLKWKNNVWVCYWCNRKFIEFRKNGEQK